MSCPFREEIDLARYLLEPGASEFDVFRAHYPDCPECSEEVALWTGIETTLAQGPHTEATAEGTEPGPWHPDVEALARYAGSPDSSGAEQTKMQRHLETCPACRTEWQALQSFDFAEVVASPFGESVTERAPATAGVIARIVAWLGLDRTPRLAAAAAFVVVLATVGIWATVGPEGGVGTRSGEDGIARRAAPTPGDVARSPGSTPAPGAVTRSADSTPAPGAVTRSADSTPAPGAVARRSEPVAVETAITSDPPATRPPASVPDRSALASAEATLPQASTPAPEASAPPPGPPDGAGSAAIQLADADLGAGDGGAVGAIERDVDEAPAAVGAGDEILLASLSQMAPPDYAAPTGSSELTWMHQFGSVRGLRTGGASVARVTAHAPDHVGLTLAASPRLWWSVSEPVDRAIVITVVDDRAIDPLLEIERPGPHAAGLGSISLAEHGVALEPGVEYRWFVTLVNDAERPSRNPVSAGSIEFVVASDAERAAMAKVPAAERGHELARRGYWYDSYDFFAGLEARHPDVAAIGNHRTRLLAAGHTAN